ncbi:hypothetical protein SmJEL517_g03946 [Synchytrium microbalum]|uniref:Uncharacterized protein n=1 Tax=Synchytrium microbalum TaxID=1806994 RepID=A0A507C6I9_9FUNG|nr:uncharacterized protein SmJEL517_g03946 [Synchytrium microbalum]TPX33095.1 hypothetical protein SmJEL517_g03946 [Synchytrium microbalum]
MVMVDEEIDVDIDIDDSTQLSLATSSSSVGIAEAPKIVKKRKRVVDTKAKQKKRLKSVVDTAQISLGAVAVPAPLLAFEEWTWSGLSDGIDESSKSLIESLLAQDQMDIASLDDSQTVLQTQSRIEDSPTPEPKSRKRSNKSAGAGGSSSTNSNTHSSRWTEEEDNLLKSAIEKHGFGSWTLIADVVKTRSPLQIKNHARHLASIGAIEGASNTSKGAPAATSKIKKSETIVNNSSTPTPAPDNVKVEASGDVKPLPVMTDNTIATLPPKDPRIPDDEDDEIDIDLEEFTEQPPPIPPSLSQTLSSVSEQSPDVSHLTRQQSEVASSRRSVTPSTASEPDTPASSSTSHHHHHHIPNSQPQPFQLTPDTQTINAFESTSLPEWFPPFSRGQKTPDRYIRVRSKILSLWQERSDRYLTKTFARRELRNEGDVNAISRVHEFLEVNGWINIGLGGGMKRDKRSGEDEDVVEGEESTYKSGRRRRVRNEKGEWVDPEDLEGRTIQEDGGDDLDDDDSSPNAEERRLLARNARYFADTEIEKFDAKLATRLRTKHNHNHELDQFTLIAFKNPSALPRTSPQHIFISAPVLMIMDIHAHLARTEIIGLLGGTFDSTTKTLNISNVIPCKSDSTDIQCEMDPISELHARTTLAAKNLVVVGWYHSHPTFEPKPSVRDLENQGAYQTLFRHADGSEPFIGAIVTPFLLSNPSNVSIIRWMAVDERPQNSTFRLPFLLNPTTTTTTKITEDDVLKVKGLFKDYRDRSDHVDLNAPYRQTDMDALTTVGTSKLDKLMESCASHFGEDADEEALRRVRACLET